MLKISPKFATVPLVASSTPFGPIAVAGSTLTVTSEAAVTSRQFALEADGLKVVIDGPSSLGGEDTERFVAVNNLTVALLSQGSLKEVRVVS